MLETWYVLTSIIFVHFDTDRCRHSGSSTAIRTHILRKAEVQCVHAILSRVSLVLPSTKPLRALTLGMNRYGLSEGSPSEAGIRSDAQLALDYIKSHPLLENTKVILYGQSIGGAVSVDLAATNPDRIAGVILENTFLNLVCFTMFRCCFKVRIYADILLQAKIATASMPTAAPYIWLGLLKDTW